MKKNQSARRDAHWISPIWMEVLSLAAACMACVAALFLLEDGSAPVSDGPVSPWKQGAQQLLSLSWEEQGVERTIVPTLSDGFIVEEDPTIKLDGQKVEDLFSTCMALRLTPVAAQSKDAGLQEDTGVLELRGSRETVTLKLGAAAPGGGRYVLREDRVYICGAFPDGLPKLSKLRAVPTLYADGTFPDSVTVSRADTAIRAGVYSGRSLGVSTLYLLAPFTWEMDIEKAAQLLEHLNALKLKEWAGNRGDRSDAAWGFDSGTVITAEYVVAGQDTPISWTLTLGGMAGGLRYAAVAGLSDVFLVDAEDAAWFDQLDPLSLVNRFAGLVALDSMTAVTAKFGEKEVVMEKGSADKPWQINGRVTEEQAFKALYQEILAPRFDGQADDTMREKAGEMLLCLVYQILDGSTETIAYRTVSTEYDLVERNGESLFYINHSKVQKLLETLESVGEQ